MTELEELYKQYKSNNWGYTGKEEKIEVPILGTITVRRMPSGVSYIERPVKKKCKDKECKRVNGQFHFHHFNTLEKMSEAWFTKMSKMIENSERENGNEKENVSEEPTVSF